jgi:hypothetical protein
MSKIPKIKEIINQLKDLDSSKFPKTEIQDLMRNVGPICDIIIHFKEGTPIIRGRPNKLSERFEFKSDYSFKPQCYNKTYQRASTPDNTMFYGVVPNIKDISNITSNELMAMRLSVFSELFHNGLNIEETPKISFGRWQVKKGEQLNVLAIIQEDKYKESNELLSELRVAYDCFVNQDIDKNLRNNSLNYGTYLANEFSKAEITSDKDYMISAVYSEIVSKHKQFDGILYPSVRAEGRYFNITIKPDVLNCKLELTDVGECPINKTKDGFRVSKSDFNANNLQEKESFKLKKTI